jgi:crotonobetainyl-CoA:carnitine CoA-transferase CaiB-like acyl-CoA transferase
MPGPLAGIRVLDLSSVVLGPLATQIMGDLGADVIKIEGPDGDTTRSTGPGRSDDMAAIFMGFNRNKRSLVLDLKQQPACDALWKLIDGADVFIHSIRPQKIAKLGFGHEAVLARNKRVVYAGIHGYRTGGPYEGTPAYDDVIQGQSGAADLMARLTGEPRYLPTILADKTCALVTAYAVMAALVERERSGQGQFVEIPMYETMVAYKMTEHLYGHTFDPPLAPMGYPRVLAPWRRPYKTSDGYICMLAYVDIQWQRYWQEVGRPEMADDPRFATLSDRNDNIAELYRIAGGCLSGRTTDEWVSTFQALDIPCARISTIEEVEADPHLREAGFFRKMEHPTEGSIVVPDIPVQFSRTAAEVARLQPKFGEHSVEVLREAGLDEDAIQGLLDSDATLKRQTDD